MDKKLFSVLLYLAFAVLCAWYGFSRASQIPLFLISPLISVIISSVALAVLLPVFRVLKYLESPEEFGFFAGRTDWGGFASVLFFLLAIVTAAFSFLKLAPMLGETAYADMLSPLSLFFMLMTALTALYSTYPDENKRAEKVRLTEWFSNFAFESAVLLLLVLVILTFFSGEYGGSQLFYHLAAFYLAFALTWLIPKKEITQPLAEVFD